MPESIFDGFVVLDSFHHDGDLIHLRLVPEFFEVGHTRPVLSMKVASCAEADVAPQKIAAIQQGSIVDIRVDSNALEVWLMHEDQPVVFQGSVTWSYEDYAVSDYVRAVEDRDRAADQMYNQIRQLRGVIDRATGFIDRAIDRAERKEGAVKPNDGRYAKEVQLLRSIRRQLAED